MASRTNHSLPDTVSATGEGTAETTTAGKSRRDVIRGLAAAAAGAIAGSVLSTGKAEAHHGTLNAESNSSTNPAIHGHNAAAGNAVEATTFGFGTAVVGTTGGSGAGMDGFSFDGIGVVGSSTRGIGIAARGLEPPSIALQVEGSARFSTAGSGSIPANQDSVFVSAPFVTALSHVTVTLTGDPARAASTPGAQAKPVVVWVERRPGSGFVVHMSRPVGVKTPLTFLVVEPMEPRK